jgi:hypothetical protein
MQSLLLGKGNPENDARAAGAGALLILDTAEDGYCNRKCKAYYRHSSTAHTYLFLNLFFLQHTVLSKMTVIDLCFIRKLKASHW